MLAKCGIAVPMSDLFGVGGTQLLDRLELPAPYAARIASLRRVMDALDFEIEVFAGLARGRLARDPGYVAVQTIPGIGPVLGAVLVAEIGDVHRFPTAQKLTCWAGMTPPAPRVRHQGPPWADHQAGVPAGPLGRGGIGAASVQALSPGRLP